MHIPEILTKRFRLIPPDKDCYGLYDRFYSNKDSSKMYGGPMNQEQIWSRLKADLGSWYLLGFGIWVIQLKSDGSQVGTCGFWQGKAWPKELTWWILPEARGQGTATEVSRAVLSYAYEVRKWKLVNTYMNDENIAARSLVKKLGGVRVDRQLFPDGLMRTIYELSTRN